MRRIQRAIAGAALGALGATGLVVGGPGPAGAATALATVPVGNAPFDLAVNPVSNRVYVPNSTDNTVSVVDGATNSVIATIPIQCRPAEFCQPAAAAVNPATNRIYVVHNGAGSAGLSVIDGATNAWIANVPAGNDTENVAVNSTTNRIYVSAENEPGVNVFDGATNAFIARYLTPTSASSEGVAVNQNTNRIYVADLDGNVSVWDGATNNFITTIAVGGEQLDVDVNPSTNRIYSTDSAGNVAVLDGAANTVLDTIALGSASDLAVNAVTNRIYVNKGNSTLAVIDGATNTVTGSATVGAGGDGVAVNATSNRVYVANSIDKTVTVLSGDQAGTSTALISSINPSLVGDEVSFTATVTKSTGSGVPTGTVQFQDGVANLGAPVPVSGAGTAELSTSSLAAGSHSITAVFSGDLNFAPSTSPMLDQQIDKRPTTLVADPAIARVGPGLEVNFPDLVAHLSSGNQPLAGRAVAFSTGSGQAICSALTDATGTASCPGSLQAVLGLSGYRASFAGDDTFEAASANGSLLVVRLRIL